MAPPTLQFSFPPKSELDTQYDGCLLDEFVDGEWTNLKLDHHRRLTTTPSISSSSGMSYPPSYPPWPPLRPSAPPTSHAINASHAALISTHSPSPKLKDEDRSLGNADSYPLDFGYRHGHNADNLGSKSSDSSPSVTTHDSSSPSVSLQSHFQQYSSSLPSRHRTSFLSAASDAFGLRKKIGSVSRKKPNFRSVPHASDIMPGVIEINARNNTTITATVGGTTAHTDYEHEERERLRDVAAQSIGLDPELLHHSCKSQSRSSLDSPQSPSQPARIPPFPATLAALCPFTELSATLPKFTPPSSLLVYALAKQWKLRTIVLTSHPVSQETHVHLFKGTSKDEKEIERLEVNTDSAIFVAEENVGGRGHVVKFAGKDFSTKQSGGIGEVSLRTTWFLQITDPAESQRWIAAIKNAVLTQRYSLLSFTVSRSSNKWCRALHAGLDIPARMDGRNEPKGDMDVMLSMRLQGIVSTHPIKPSTAISLPSPSIPTSPSPPPSFHSLKMNVPSSPSPTIAMKGIFSGTRPRSPSVEGSPTLAYPPGHAEDSFGAAGTSLLTMLRTKSSADSSSSPSQSLVLPLSHVPGQGSPVPSLRSTNAPVVITASDLKISKERDAPELSIVVPEASSSSTPPGSSTPPTPSHSRQGTLTLSLQPPPRKCKHAVANIPATSLHEPRGMYKQAGGNGSVAGNFGIPSRDSSDVTPRGSSPISHDSSSFLGGQPESFSPSSGFEPPFPCVGEAHGSEHSGEVTPTLLGSGIVNSSSPGGGSVSIDRLVQSTAIIKRWSRQGVPLPKQLTPPSGPPPSIPPSPEKTHRISVESSISIPVIYTADRSPSSSSSNSHSQAQISPRSGSSTYSASSASTSSSQSWSQRPMPFRGESFSSSLGSVVSNGTSSRPMSMSVLGSSPVAHIGTAKRRSMPPPRPAPNFAPPPAPTVQESASGPASLTMLAPAPQKILRSSVAQRALRLSLTSPKPPPSSALPPRPDEAAFVQGDRRSSSTGTPDLESIPAPSSRPTLVLSGSSNTMQPTSPLPRYLSIRQRLRILSTPPASPPPVQSPSSSIPSAQVSTLDLSDDNDDDLPTPCFQLPPHPFGLGEHIVTFQNDPSFLQLEAPVTPTIPKPPPRSPYRRMPPSLSTMSGLRIPSLEVDRDFVALSPPPPRRGSKPHVVAGARPKKLEVERSGSVEQEERRPAARSHSGSVVSLGFVAT
ncbi:hypothetical protein J3R82DRAFT_9606 [Butyriboletus roseoflavus]|nr:hypothetical protein J3R82DRAFT_9606 [Butyriboletus roseoflavus]